jgi:hypothetical protein
MSGGQRRACALRTESPTKLVGDNSANTDDWRSGLVILVLYVVRTLKLLAHTALEVGLSRRKLGSGQTSGRRSLGLGSRLFTLAGGPVPRQCWVKGDRRDERSPQYSISIGHQVEVQM